MDRRNFALKGMLLAPAASLLLATAEAEARKKPPGRRPRPRHRPRRATPPIVKVQTFSNRSQIRLRDHAPADPYPSTISISGLTGARILDVNPILHGLSHDRPFDVAVMLVSPWGKGVILMQNVGGNLQVINVEITIDDHATEEMPREPDTSIKTGTYKPTNAGLNYGVFPAPAPQTGIGLDLADFNGGDPNGEWKLFALDDSSLISGVFASGWSLVLTYEIPAPRKPTPPKPKRPKRRPNRKNRKNRG